MASAKDDAGKPSSGEAEVKTRQRQSKPTDETVFRAKKKNLGEDTGVSGVRDVTRYVKPSVQYMLWGMAAGRCEFNGCNKPLWKSSVTQEQVNIAEKAHIYSFSGEGPRGNEEITDEQLNGCRSTPPRSRPRRSQSRDGGPRNTVAL